MKFLIVVAIALIGFFGCAQREPVKEKMATPKSTLDSSAVAYFASGCFWCVEGVYEEVEGVYEVESGYAGGHVDNPSYAQVCAGTTGHAETVKVYYNPKKVSYKTLVEVFFGSHDPTTLNKQGPDEGTQYRSAVFYQTDEELKIIKDYIAELKRDLYKESKITTEVSKLTTFYKAEDYHQDYERLNPNNSYIRAVSRPRLQRFKEQYPDLIKKEE